MIYAKRIAKALVFLAGLFVLLLDSSRIFMPKNNTKADGMEYELANGVLAEKEGSLDVLVLGDSEAYSSIIPMKIWNDAGITSYNCSNGGQHLSYSYVLLRRACEKQKPKVVFLEANAIYRSESAAQAVYDELSEILPVFRYHDRWKHIKSGDFTKGPEYTARQFDKGYTYVTTTIPSDTPPDPENSKPTKEKDSISRLNRMSVQAIKRYCDSIGAKLVLLSVPSTTNWNYKRHNSTSYLAEDLGIDFIDMNLLTEEIPIDWNHDTRDKGDHLNYKGACKVTAYLASYLNNTGLFTSHKEDPEFSDWVEDYKLFEEELKHEKAA